MINKITRNWGKKLVAAAVSAAATNLLAALGISGAEMLGINIPKLDANQMVAVAISGAVVGVAMYLKQSPVPPDTEEPTEQKPV